MVFLAPQILLFGNLDPHVYALGPKYLYKDYVNVIVYALIWAHGPYKFYR